MESCIQSLVNQKFEGMEILLVDDGSVDKSSHICDRFAKDYSFVRVFHRENQGVSAARNYGIGQAQGEYLLFVDSDDYVDSDYCSIIDQAISSFGTVDILTFGGIEERSDNCSMLRDMSGRRPFISTGHDYLLECYRANELYSQVWMYAYRREYVEKHKLRFVEGILHEDVEFTPRAIMAAEQILTIDANPYHYRVRDNSISTQKNKQKNIKDLFYVLNLQVDIANHQEKQLKKWMLNAVLNSYLSMVQEARMYRPEYRPMLNKSFLWGKAATSWNCFRVLLCTLNVKAYCLLNDIYRRVR